MNTCATTIDDIINEEKKLIDTERKERLQQKKLPDEEAETLKQTLRSRVDDLNSALKYLMRESEELKGWIKNVDLWPQNFRSITNNHNRSPSIISRQPFPKGHEMGICLCDLKQGGICLDLLYWIDPGHSLPSVPKQVIESDLVAWIQRHIDSELDKLWTNESLVKALTRVFHSKLFATR